MPLPPVPQSYKGREQALIKHIVLEKYLESLAYKALFTFEEFTFVDGFSGPWKSSDTAFQDTSFMKAIQVLTRVQRDVRARKRSAYVRCIFIEKTRAGFDLLEKAVSSVTDIKIIPLRGEFENLIPDILKLAPKGFLLAFIDPKGWTGFSLQKIKPLLARQPNEVLINFMYDFVRRFIQHDDPKIQQSLDQLFGSTDWRLKLGDEQLSEEMILNLFGTALKELGAFQHVISTPILKPTKDRTLYRLVFGTRHEEGVSVYRDAEREALKQQYGTRESAKIDYRVEKSKQEELLTADVLPLEAGFNKIIEDEKAKAQAVFLEALQPNESKSYGELWPIVLLKCRVRRVELNKIVGALRKARAIEISSWQSRQQVPKDDDLIRLSSLS